jgi:hypothetical protein
MDYLDKRPKLKEMDLREIGWGCTDWVDLDQDRD